VADPFKKIQLGDPVPRSVTAINAMLAAGQAEVLRRNGRTSNDLTSNRDACLVRVWNNTGVDQNARSIVGLDGPIFVPDDPNEAFLREVTFQGIVPVDPDHVGKFGILYEPARAGQVVRAYLMGVTTALVDLGDLSHTRADISDGDTTVLVSGDDGAAQILWHELDTTGEQWALVRIGAGAGSGGAMVGLTGAGGIPAAISTTLGHASCTLYRTCADDGTLGGGFAAEVYNAAEDPDGAIAGTKRIIVVPAYAGKWLCIWEQCDANPYA
jgi:hypothetical protein